MKLANSCFAVSAAVLASAASAQTSVVPDVSTQPPTSASSTTVEVAAQEGTGELYCRRKLGTWFYCDKPKAKPAIPAAPPPAPTETADARLKAIGRELDELKAKAVLEPTTENVTAYIRYQRQQLDRASTFADVWQRSIWQSPELDYTLQRPVSTVAKRAWMDNRSAERSAVMRRISQRYGMFYFYAQSCAACEIQGPILKSVAESNRIHVQAVSMDGGPNGHFPNYVVDSGQRIRMGLTSRATPALVLYDTATKRPIVIGTGVMAADEIMDRIFTLTETRPGTDY